MAPCKQSGRLLCANPRNRRSRATLSPTVTVSLIPVLFGQILRRLQHAPTVHRPIRRPVRPTARSPRRVGELDDDEPGPGPGPGDNSCRRGPHLSSAGEIVSKGHRRRAGAPRGGRRRSGRRRGDAPAQGAARPDRRAGPPDIAAVGRALPGIRQPGRLRTAAVLRDLARIGRSVRPHPGLRTAAADPAGRHPAGADPVDDPARRLPRGRRRRDLGNRRPDGRARLRWSQVGRPLVWRVRGDLPRLGYRGHRTGC